MTPPSNDPQLIQTPFPNPSLQVTADHQLKFVEAPVYAPRRGEVLLQIKATGICGSDIHFWKTGRIGQLVFEGDCIIGHEAAGVVLKCGEGVTRLKPGDRVAVEPGVPCEQCFLCHDGRYNLCEDVQFAGVYPYAGTLQRYKVHPARWLHKRLLLRRRRPPRTALRRHARHTSGPPKSRPGVVICGAGPIGLVALAAARASGAHPIVITDVEPRRLAFAKEFVPSCITYQVDLVKDAQGNAKAIKTLFGESEYVAPETVLECTGVESSVCTAAYTARRGGVVVVIGVGKATMNNLPFMHMSLAEIDLRFINRYRDTWPSAIACLSGGILGLKKLVSHVFPLVKAKEALHLCADPGKGSMKVMVVDEVDASL
ncbi:putative alcohol dehydrogenase [Aspergillus novofumigatus IBT 16806]|uniref:Probable D-xylulose reductase A n=1 Tax=Aspergillus novofumigatus (strain IBT 16806) TaxID=1392255 RepID=A0A2I1BVG1_ASPN1|nr:sorbitol dehydrogenase [Aspergillus novofumigatus IBT 16806]PKX89359.1 sorbitol dehydrogenase [Aspergillus novofumigatus IBT 16806]